MRRHPRGVVDHGVHAEAHVDEPAAAAEPQHEEGEAGGEHHRPVPGQRGDPAEPSAPAAQASGDLHRGRDGEDREQRRRGDERREAHLQELEGHGLLRIHEQVVHADRQAVDEEQDEGEPPHRVRVEPPAGGLRRHGVEGDIGREEPEIDDRVQRPREQRARQSDIDGEVPAEGRRDDLEQELDGDPDGGPQPHHRIGHGREHGERHRHARIVALEAEHGEDHQPAPQPRPHHHQHEADVEIGARGDRRIEGEQHGRRAARDRRRRHSGADDAEGEAGPGEDGIGQRTLEGGLGHVIAEAHHHEGGEHVGHEHAVRGHGREVVVRRQERRRQRAPRPHLPDAEHAGDREGREADPEMGERQVPSVRHRSPSPRRPA